MEGATNGDVLLIPWSINGFNGCEPMGLLPPLWVKIAACQHRWEHQELLQPKKWDTFYHSLVDVPCMIHVYNIYTIYHVWSRAFRPPASSHALIPVWLVILSIEVWSHFSAPIHNLITTELMHAGSKKGGTPKSSFLFTRETHGLGALFLETSLWVCLEKKTHPKRRIVPKIWWPLVVQYVANDIG